MKLTPNLNSTWRMAYIVLGAGLVAWPVLFTIEGWPRFALPILGVLSVFTGATGY